MVVVDTGDHFFRDLHLADFEVAQAKRKADLLAEGARACGVAVVCPGESDLARGWPEYLALCKAAGAEPICANLTIGGEPALPPTAIREVGGIRLGFVGLFRIDRPLPVTDGKPMQVTDAVEAARRAVAALAGQVDVVVALSHMGLDHERDLVKKVPRIQVVVGGHTREVLGVGTVVGDCAIHQAGYQGKYIGRVPLRVGRRGAKGEPPPVERLAGEATEIKEALAEAPEWKTKVDEYNKWVAVENQKAIQRPAPAEQEHHGAAHDHDDDIYWGASLCGQCHVKQDNFWKGSIHSHAYETLVKAKKQHDVDCLRCHSTAFEKTRHRPGVKSMSDVTGLESVQCESCHAPGSRHNTSEIRLRASRKQTCTQCHDPKNSPKFDFETWLPKMRCPAGS
jgi:hypothetical protein